MSKENEQKRTVEASADRLRKRIKALSDIDATPELRGVLYGMLDLIVDTAPEDEL